MKIIRSNKVMEEIKEVLCEFGIELKDMYNSYGDDDTELVYEKDGVELYFAPDYYYMDIIGLEEEQWRELRKMMGEKDHLEFNDKQIQDIIPALYHYLKYRIETLIKYPMMPPINFTKNDIEAIPIIINKLRTNDINNITRGEVYVIDSAVEQYAIDCTKYDTDERKQYDIIRQILKNYELYMNEYNIR